MKAVTVVPGTSGSTRFDDVPEPAPELGSVVVQSLVVGVCGTDVLQFDQL
jgi:D-arabinose 1-dehydrogenase-like Zn-dependent alcohol dehydrogenase